MVTQGSRKMNYDPYKQYLDERDEVESQLEGSELVIHEVVKDICTMAADGITVTNSFETIETMTVVQKLNSAVGAPQQLLPRTTDEHLIEVKHALENLKVTVEEEGKAARDADKMRRIEFALCNTHLVSKDFHFCQATKPTGKGYQAFHYIAVPVNASELLQDILLSFRKGTGHLLPLYFIDLSKSGNTKFKVINKEWEEVFRNKLCDKLDRLLGQYPRFQFRLDGRVMLYYS